MRYLILLIFCILPGLLSLKAQTAIASSGGEATGTGGSASYTAGQVVYSVQESPAGIVIQGCQQPYEVFVVTGINKETETTAEFAVFPNPSSDYVIIRIDKIDPGKLSLHLFNNNGNLIMKKEISGRDTVLETDELPSSSYYLNILDGQIVIKKFVIIKN